MSSTLPTPPPFQQWQQFFPNGNAYGYDQNELNQILSGVSGTYATVKQQAAGDIARDTLRAIDRNGQDNMSTTERTAAQLAMAIERNGSMGMNTTQQSAAELASAVERNGANGMSTTERVNSQLAMAVERNGAGGISTTERAAAQLASAVDRNGALNFGAIERTAGEARLTTVVADAATRQATNDSIRDVLRAVDLNGSNGVVTTKDAHNGLLGAIERNAGEGRMTTVTTSGHMDARMTDVRHAIIADMNRGTNELLGTIRQSNEALTASIHNGHWETRNDLKTGFGQSMIEHLKGNNEINENMYKAHAIQVLESQKLGSRSDDQYASLLLEQQKVKEYLSSKSDNHFAINQLEQHKVKEYLSNKGDNHFAINQLEMQKVKEGLAMQACNNYSSTQLEIQKVREGLSTQSSEQFAITQLEAQKVREQLSTQSAQQFAISQLEAQKVREQLSSQLAEAKYEALKSQQVLSDKMRECCCEVKMKIDDIDRDRLRDKLIVQKEKTNTFELLEMTDLLGRGRGYGGHGRRRSRSRSGSRERR
jgi:hypothetical protein